MAFTDEDKHAITFLRKNKNYGVTRLLKEFPDKGWTLGGLKTLLSKIDRTGTFQRRPGSGRPRSARTTENVELVESLILSQEDEPQTHHTQRQISREIGISQSSVRRIVKSDLRLRCLKKRRAHELTEQNKRMRLQRSVQLLRLYPASLVNFIWFTDEKLFTVATPNNSQNDRLYVANGVRKRDVAAKRLLRTRPTFSKSLMVSVGVSALGRTNIHFIEPGVKINGQYYRDVLLMQGLLPDIRELSEYFIFQQDGAPAHRARETVELLQAETPGFISPALWPPNSPDLNPVDYKIWGYMQEMVYRVKIRDLNHLRQRITEVWNEIDQRVIDESVNQWRIRLRACARERGAQFEHKL